MSDFISFLAVLVHGAVAGWYGWYITAEGGGPLTWIGLGFNAAAVVAHAANVARGGTRDAA